MLALLCVLGGCRQAPALPPDPGLAGDALGLGISLGSRAEQIPPAAAESAGLQLVVLSREELLNHDLYGERKAGQDLVAVITEQDGVGVQVAEIRAYLGGPDESSLELLGEPLATLGPDAAVKRWGEAASRNVEQTGVTHLEWRFEPAARSAGAIVLVLSFGDTGHCFAAALRTAAL